MSAAAGQLGRRFAFSSLWRFSRPFAGIWMPWHGTRGTKANPVEGAHQLFGFLTTDANDVVGAVHPKAMPAILTTLAEIDAWMTAPTEEALKLQRPLPDGALRTRYPRDEVGSMNCFSRYKPQPAATARGRYSKLTKCRCLVYRHQTRE